MAASSPAIAADTPPKTVADDSPSPSETPASIRISKLFIVHIGNQLREPLLAEISSQLGDRVTIVTRQDDADAILEGSGVARDGLNYPSLSLFDRTHKTILWSGEATDPAGGFSANRNGGETRIAERLVGSLKQYLEKE